MSDPSIELAARMPWIVAEGGTWWEVTGEASPKHTFERCIARVLPRGITGVDVPLFEVLIYGSPLYVSASAITKARQMELVYADEYDDLRATQDGGGQKEPPPLTGLVGIAPDLGNGACSVCIVRYNRYNDLDDTRHDECRRALGGDGRD